MTTPFSLLTGNFSPSLQQLNTLINQLNALFPNITIAGDEAVTGNLAVTGTTALTGNAAAAGTLTVTGLTTTNGGIAGGSSANIAINTNKFTVAASTGNTLVAGTLAVTGASTLTGAVGVTGTLTTAGHTARSTANALTAIGTDRGTSLALTKDINNVTTALSGTGVTLPAGVTGEEVIVFNNGANAIIVYGNGSDTVDGNAGTAGVTLSAGARAVFMCVAANTILSALMGAVSA
jgi:hypothetical protein